MNDDEQLKADQEFIKSTMRISPEVLQGASPQVLQEFSFLYTRVLEIHQRKEDRLDAELARIRKEAPGLDMTVFETEQRLNKELADEAYKTLNMLLSLLVEGE